jgi:phosphate transport system substrate-binding protein
LLSTEQGPALKGNHGMFFDRRLNFAPAVFAVALGVLGCTIETYSSTADEKVPSGERSASGKESRIQIDGSSTVKVITAAVAEEFESRFTDVKIALKVTGTGTGFKEMIAGRIDIANASRPVKGSEKADCEKNGIELLELKVALDGLTVCVNKGNTWVDSMTVAQLRKIWEPGTKIRSWKDVDASWPDVPIVLFGAGEESGTFDYFTEVINGKEDAITDNYSPSADDNVTITGVSGDKGGMGFFGCAYYFSNKDKVKALRISPTDNPADGVAPTPEAVKAGDYRPLSRPLFIYVKKSSLARQEVQDFVRFYLNEGAAQISNVGYVDLADDQMKASRDALEAAIAK